MASETIKLNALDGGSFDAYVTHPPHGPAPAIVVWYSAFGLTDGLIQAVNQFAAHGYLVIVPEVFWRSLPGPLPQTDEGREKAVGRYKSFDIARGLDDLKVTIDAARAMPECNGKVATMGYCMGGRYAFLGVARFGADAAVTFHGNSIGEHLDEAQNLRNPQLSLHYGSEDPQITMDEVRAVKGALEGFPGVMVYVYPGAKHGFAQIGGRAYDADACALAEKRALDFLDGLKTPVPA